MTASEFVVNYRSSSKKGNLSELDELISFKQLSTGVNDQTDANLDFRTKVVERLLNDFSLTDISLIRKLLKEEIACDRITYRHDNLYQLCFYLFTLGQVEDTFILYDAKFNATNMDVGCMLDRTAITVGHEIDDVVRYVKKEFEKDPTRKQRYPEILNELQSLKEYPDYNSIADYSNFIKGYFFGHENVMPNSQSTNLKDTGTKQWWKFW